MAKMFLMCGCSGVGKTTFAKAFAERNGLLYLGVDEFYAKINGDECLHINFFEVWIEYFKAIHEAEINNIDCVVDTNAITFCHREQFIEWFPSFEHHLICIDADYELRMKNNQARRRQVPEEAMRAMSQRFQYPYDGTENKKWKTIRYFLNTDNKLRGPEFWRGEKDEYC